MVEYHGLGSIPSPHRDPCVLEQDTFTPQRTSLTVNIQWLRPNMTEKLLTGTLNLNTKNNVQFIYENYVYS